MYVWFGFISVLLASHAIGLCTMGDGDRSTPEGAREGVRGGASDRQFFYLWLGGLGCVGQLVIMCGSVAFGYRPEYGAWGHAVARDRMAPLLRGRSRFASFVSLYALWTAVAEADATCACLWNVSLCVHHMRPLARVVRHGALHHALSYAMLAMQMRVHLVVATIHAWGSEGVDPYGRRDGDAPPPFADARDPFGGRAALCLLLHGAVTVSCVLSRDIIRCGYARGRGSVEGGSRDEPVDVPCARAASELQINRTPPRDVRPATEPADRRMWSRDGALAVERSTASIGVAVCAACEAHVPVDRSGACLRRRAALSSSAVINSALENTASTRTKRRRVQWALATAGAKTR